MAHVWKQWMALVSRVINFVIPQNGGKFLSTCTTACLSLRAHLHEDTTIVEGLYASFLLLTVPPHPATFLHVDTNVTIASGDKYRDA
jgi:hypothetical protein